MAFNILINEHQRVAIVLMIKHALETPAALVTLEHLPPDLEPTALEDVKLLVEMLEDLPNIEAQHPGITHGLCL